MIDTKELKEDELKKVSGGNYGTMMHVTCPCNCGATYYVSGRIPPANGTVLGTCCNGWKATYVGSGSIEVNFYNESTNQTITKNLSSSL